jgi:pentose-5-phosphate-3-epimerase
LRDSSGPSSVKSGEANSGRLLEALPGRAFSIFVTFIEHDDIPSFELNLTEEGGLALQLETPLEVVVPYLDKIQLILLMGTRLGVKDQSLDPNTYAREQTVRQVLRDHGYEGRVKIGVDGGIREQTVPFLRNAAADLVVPGSLVFKSDHLAQTFQWLHAL